MTDPARIGIVDMGSNAVRFLVAEATGGKIAILELSEPRDGAMGALARFYVRGVVPRVGGALSGKREYRYLQESIAAFPPPAEFAETMRASGLDVIETVPLMFGAAVLFVGTPAEGPRAEV